LEKKGQKATFFIIKTKGGTMKTKQLVTWQQIDQLNLSYGTLLEIIAELVNGETSIQHAREKILNGELD
tara:strand:+ start:368 stop:574 length:207 start_codon:yes stop_codon:yes gene_type:complete